MQRSLAFIVVAIACATGLVLASPQPAAAKGCANAKAMPRSISKAAFARAVVCLTNKERSKRGLARVRPNEQLRRGAAKHNRLMLRRDCFSHHCPGELELSKRLARSGYIFGGLRRWLVGENLAWGERHKGTPRALVKAWMHSPGHRANILKPQFRDIGVAVHWGRPGSSIRNAATVTQEFGYRR